LRRIFFRQIARAQQRDERKQKRPQGHCDSNEQFEPNLHRWSKRENKNARKGIATSGVEFVQIFHFSGEKTKTPARALRRALPRPTTISRAARENKNARKGIATLVAPSSVAQVFGPERKQKRPQGHCDFNGAPNWLWRCVIVRENKNARKGIATKIDPR